MMSFGHEDMLKAASHYLEMSRGIVYMRPCRRLYCFFRVTLLLIGFDIPSCEYMKLMMDSGIRALSPVVLLAMVIPSDTHVAEIIGKATGSRSSFDFIDLVTRGSMLNLRSKCAISYYLAIERDYQTPRFLTEFKGRHPADMFLGFESGRRESWLLLILFGVWKFPLCFELSPPILIVTFIVEPHFL